MPGVLHPMLATPIDKAFSDPAWLYEIKWDGYRALGFLQNGRIRFVSRNQNDLTPQYPELASLGSEIRAQSALLDGEICALDEQGRASFSLMQSRTGLATASATAPGRRIRHGQPNPAIPIAYYVFDLVYLDGFDLRHVGLAQRKELLRRIVTASPGRRMDSSSQAAPLRYSDHFTDGLALYEAARQHGLEGIVAKRRDSEYVEKRSRDWLKMKLTRQQECVIGGYTDPRGSREHFGSIVLGLYDHRGHLLHVGQAGSGFTEASHEEMWRRLRASTASTHPFTARWNPTAACTGCDRNSWPRSSSPSGLMKAKADKSKCVPPFTRDCASTSPRENAYSKTLPPARTRRPNLHDGTQARGDR